MKLSKEDKAYMAAAAKAAGIPNPMRCIDWDKVVEKYKDSVGFVEEQMPWWKRIALRLYHSFRGRP